MNSSDIRYFCIADHYVKVIFTDTQYNNMFLLRSYYTFLCDPVPDEDLLLEVVVDDTTKAIEKSRRERVKEFQTGNGTITVDTYDDGAYQFIFKDLAGTSCGMFQVDKERKHVKCALTGTYDMRCFGINNTMMLNFALASSLHQTLLIHASLVRQNGYGYAFHASSGTGKSTQVSMWLRYLPNCDLMNDDNPVIRVIDGVPYIYGTPWSGKTPCYRRIKARLGALTRIDRDDHNWVEKLRPVEGFTSITPSCTALRWDVKSYRNVCDTVTKIVETTNAYILHCLPNREAAEVCNAAIAVKQ